MKRCPQCRRSYSDETLNYCLDDGSTLVYGSADEPATAVLPNEGATRIRPASDQPELRSELEPDPPSATSGPGQKSWVISAIIVAIIAAGGFFAFRYLPFGDRGNPIDSIAVLPFQNRNADADSEYLSNGLAESLIYRLSQLSDLKVSPTSTVFRYQGAEIDPVKVGNELGVSAVLSGRIVQHGDSITISADLVDVKNNRLLWGEQYDRKMSELLETQREIAKEIVENLKLKVAPD